MYDGQSFTRTDFFCEKPGMRSQNPIVGLTGQDLAQQPDVAARLSAACQAIKNTVVDPGNVSKLTGRLKRRVVLD